MSSRTFFPMLCRNSIMSAVEKTECMLSFCFLTNLERNKVIRFGKEKVQIVYQIICLFALSHSSFQQLMVKKRVQVPLCATSSTVKSFLLSVYLQGLNETRGAAFYVVASFLLLELLRKPDLVGHKPAISLGLGETHTKWDI